MQESAKKDLAEQLIDLVNNRLAEANRELVNGHLSDEFFALIDHAITESQESEQKQVSILLSDLRGFTALSEHCKAMELIELLNRYLQKMSEIVLRYQGTIDKFMGDSIMALFGAPIGRPNDLERTIACAIEMQLAMGDINEVNIRLGLPELFMGIGINTGPVIAGNLGSALHSEYTVIGNEVNLASRIEAHSLRGQILLSENTYQLAKDFIEVAGVNEVLVKGKHEAVKMYELKACNRPQRLEVPQREARKGPRVQIDAPLNFQMIEGKTVSKTKRSGRILDMGYGGLLVRVPEVLEAYAEIRIGFALSLMSEARSDVYARVLRAQEVDGQWECQLEFTFIEDEARKELKAYIDQIVETS